MNPASDPSPAPYQLTLLPQGVRLPVRAGQSLLAAALEAGVPLRRLCRNGTCRACLCRCVAGVAVHTIEWPGLSADEREAGWVLPCVAQARSDLTLDTEAP